jgi:exonuclease VII large subunit
MRPNIAACLFVCMLLGPAFAYCQSDETNSGGVVQLPGRLLRRIEDKTASLDQQLTRQTEKYLQRMQRREQRLYKKLYKSDSAAAKALFAGSAGQYTAFAQKLANDTGGAGRTLSGEYRPYTDSIQGMLKFLNTNPSGALTTTSPQLQSSLRQLQSLEAKMQDADQVKEYVRQRKQQIAQYIQQHTNLASLLGKDYQGMNQDLYYYSQQVRQYKEMLNDPDKLEKEALTLLDKLPAFQSFMKQNSQLAGLFNLPGNYGSPGAVAGLQTRDQVAALIQQQVSAGGAGGAAALQGNLQSAQSQLDGYKDKLSQLGGAAVTSTCRISNPMSKRRRLSGGGWNTVPISRPREIIMPFPRCPTSASRWVIS